MQQLEAISKTINKLVGYLIVMLFTVLIVACFLQVFTRYVLNNALFWTEELARYSFIWANLMGATICIRNHSHATVTAVYDLFKGKLKLFIDFVIQFIIMFVAFVMVRYGFSVFVMTMGQLSPALKIYMSIIYFAVPLSGLLIMFYTIIDLMAMVSKLHKGDEN